MSNIGSRMLASLFSEDWGDYPEPHTDEDDSCMCPDHKLMRRSGDGE